MTKSELKKTALESMNEAGAAMEQGQYLQAKNYAEKAWNCYYELQKQRNDDEDFTDLIYWARDLYQKANDELSNCAPQEEEKEDDNLADDYLHILKLHLGGAAGNSTAALEAAEWYLNPKHWTFLTQKDPDFLTKAYNLLQGVLSNSRASDGDKARAADLIAQMHRQPQYNKIDIDKCIESSKLAIAMAQSALDLLPEDKYTIFTHALDNLLCRPEELAYAEKVAQELLDAGYDKGILYPICSYYYRHNSDKSTKIENELYEAGVWQGIFLHGQTLTYTWINDPTNENFAAMEKYNLETLSYCADQNADTPAGDDLAGLSLFIAFLCQGKAFLTSDLMDWFIRIANQNSAWGCYYLSILYNITAQRVSDDEAKAQEYTDQEMHYLAMGVGMGHRSSILSYLVRLETRNGDPELIEKYKKIAHELDVVLE